MVSGLATQPWATNMVAHHWERLSVFAAVILPIVLYLGVGPAKISPSKLMSQLILPLCCLCSHFLEGLFHSRLLYILKKNYLVIKCSSFFNYKKWRKTGGWETSVNRFPESYACTYISDEEFGPRTGTDFGHGHRLANGRANIYNEDSYYQLRAFQFLQIQILLEIHSESFLSLARDQLVCLVFAVQLRGQHTTAAPQPTLLWPIKYIFSWFDIRGKGVLVHTEKHQRSLKKLNTPLISGKRR